MILHFSQATIKLFFLFYQPQKPLSDLLIKTYLPSEALLDKAD
jgi:hypothetical protein